MKPPIINHSTKENVKCSTFFIYPTLCLYERQMVKVLKPLNDRHSPGSSNGRKPRRVIEPLNVFKFNKAWFH